MARFVLVHGAWHGGWCWQPLRAELEARGHHVSAPTLPSDDPAAGVEEWAEGIGAHPEAVVVAHSFSGFVLPLVEARLHVYLCSFVPAPGRPPSAILGEALEPGFGGTERDDLGRTYWPSLDVAAERLYRGHDRAWAEWAFPRLRPQAQTVAHTPCPLAALPTTPAVSVLAREDSSIRPDWARATAREVLGVEPLEVDGGHFPMLDRPLELAELLEGVLEHLP